MQRGRRCQVCMCSWLPSSSLTEAQSVPDRPCELTRCNVWLAVLQCPTVTTTTLSTSPDQSSTTVSINDSALLAAYPLDLVCLTHFDTEAAALPRAAS
jgi:hypothetical protein